MVKLNIADRSTGETESVELEDERLDRLVGKELGDTVSGEVLGVEHDELTITGATDSSGFPHRRDVAGGAKKRYLLSGGVGLRSVPTDGYRKKKTVRGKRITRDVAQVNLVVEE